MQMRDDCSFTYYNNDRTWHDAIVDDSLTHTTADATVKDFRASACAYWTGALHRAIAGCEDSSGEASSLADMSHRRLVEELYVPDEGGDVMDINLWLSKGGTNSGLHYDSYDNFLIQVEGRKKVVLISARHHLDVSLYPSPHPSWRQSQLSFKSRSRLPGIIEVDLEPGQALYIPPYHFHEITAYDQELTWN